MSFQSKKKKSRKNKQYEDKHHPNCDLIEVQRDKYEEKPRREKRHGDRHRRDKKYEEQLFEPPSYPYYPSDFSVQVEAYVAGTATLLENSWSGALHYRLPRFRASAVIIIPAIRDRHHWTFGWIQACTKLISRNEYGDYGFTTWHVPYLENDGCVNDSDGKRLPWYAERKEALLDMHGPTAEPTEKMLRMVDAPESFVVWRMSLRNKRLKNELVNAQLTHAYRQQKFTVWLTAHNQTTGKTCILRTLQWEVTVDIDVDCKKPIGSRCRLKSPVRPKQPIILTETAPIPPAAVTSPAMNSCQVLVWQPTVGSPRVISPTTLIHESTDTETITNIYGKRIKKRRQ